MYRLLSVLLLLSIVVSAGCSSNQSIKDSWKYSKRQYYAYVNTPATLDLDDKGSASSYQRALGEVVIDVDTKLKRFLRVMENADISPNEQWVMDMFSKFPWLSGVALVGADGEVHSRFPDQGGKELDIAPLLTEDPKQSMVALRTFMTQGAAPEVYIGKPVYNDGVFRGLVVAFFDPQVLVQSAAGDTSRVAMYCPYGPLWTGSAAAFAVSAGKDWGDELTRRSSGYGGSGSGEYYWTTRYIGNMPIVYAIATAAEPLSAQNEAPAQGTTSTVPVARDVYPDSGEDN